MKKILLCFLFPFCLSVVSCGWLDEDYTTQIGYEVTGTAYSVNITMSNSGGNTEQMTGVSIPWSKEFSIKTSCYRPYENPRIASLSAQSNDSSGSVTVKIYKNGNLFQTATSSGAYVTATASGRIDKECPE
jgi:hypothetical protein